MDQIALSLGLADHEHVQVTHDRRSAAATSPPIGAGKVGGSLVAQLAERGATVLVADVDPERVRAAAMLSGVSGMTVEQMLREPLDVLSPCARGGIAQVGGEFLGWTADAVERSLGGVVGRVGALLDEAAAAGELPLELALRDLRRRVEETATERVAA